MARFRTACAMLVVQLWVFSASAEPLLIKALQIEGGRIVFDTTEPDELLNVRVFGSGFEVFAIGFRPTALDFPVPVRDGLAQPSFSATGDFGFATLRVGDARIDLGFTQGSNQGTFAFNFEATPSPARNCGGVVCTSFPFSFSGSLSVPASPIAYALTGRGQGSLITGANLETDTEPVPDGVYPEPRETTFNFASPAVVPEPSTLLLLTGAGVISIARQRLRNRRGRLHRVSGPRENCRVMETATVDALDSSSRVMRRHLRPRPGTAARSG
jgi:hypothetical protein